MCTSERLDQCRISVALGGGWVGGGTLEGLNAHIGAVGSVSDQCRIRGKMGWGGYLGGVECAHRSGRISVGSVSH
eukprot:1178747-Prorocentrum_minimum.AAC.2